MKECLHKKFNLNGQVVDCSVFNLDLINTGTSIYEVIRVINGKYLFLQDHLDRLDRSINMAGLRTWYSHSEIHEMIIKLPRINDITDGNVKIVLNYQDEKPNRFLSYFVDHHYPTESDYKNGVSLEIFPFTRNDPQKKIWRPDYREEVYHFISNNNIYEILLADDQGRVTEASKANIFAILKNLVITPPAEMVLPGVTRKYILSICTNHHIEVLEKEIYRYDLHEFDAFFLTGTSPKVIPVARIGDNEFEVDHPIVNFLMKEYDSLIYNYLVI